MPKDLLTALRAHCSSLRAQFDQLKKELFLLLDALARRSVTAVPFKGPLLGELLFGDAGLRSPGDLDLLIRPSDVVQVCDVLEERGYVDADQRVGMSRMNPRDRRYYRGASLGPQPAASCHRH